MEQNWRDVLRLYTYYILISALSVISLIIFPLLNSNVKIVDTFPKNAAGWLIYITIRVLVVFMNLLIFSNFLAQAKVNVAENENYKKAIEILSRNKPKNYKPKSPAQFLGRTWALKGMTLVVTTIASLFAIGDALLSYDYMILIATIFTIVMSIVLGVMEMKRTEIYYCGEFLDYANFLEKEKKNDNN